jgi:hypothetical protein
MAIDKRFYRGRKKPLPVGQVYAFPLGDGRFGACRVIREGTAAEHSVGEFLVAACAYIDDAPPSTVDRPDVRRMLPLTHHFYGKIGELKPLGGWVNGPPPKEFISVGTLAPSADDLAAKVHHFIYWSAITEGVLDEWRWAHDRDAVLAEDAVEAAEVQRRQAEADRAKAAVTLASFQKQKLFPDWADPTPRKMIGAARKVMKEAAAQLEALGPKPDKRKARAILRRCIETFNELDEANDHWIETIEREDIVETFDILARLVGFSDDANLADEWRDW